MQIKLCIIVARWKKKRQCGHCIVESQVKSVIKQEKGLVETSMSLKGHWNWLFIYLDIQVKEHTSRWDIVLDLKYDFHSLGI